MVRLKFRDVVLVAAMLSWNGVHAEEVTAPQRDLVEAYLAKDLVLPETAEWRFVPIKPYLGDTRLICGQVNYQSSARKYMGFHRFYALIEDSRITLAQIEDARQDVTGKLREKLDFLCGPA